MNLRFIVSISLSMVLSFCYTARADKFQEYIDNFAQLAIEQQQEFGIPASITLAQGILESGAGRSRLAKEGNNHFGIKCHKDWKGASMLQDDDAPDECFRVYNTPAESYRDHSRFLKRDRYKPLFQLDILDYKGWAAGLKQCGYATDPKYAERLVTIIERYVLYTYDTERNPLADETAAFIRDAIAMSHPVRKSHGLHYVVAVPGDTYKSLAKEFGIKENKLKSYNDASKNEVIKEWEEIYLQPKNEKSDSDIKTTTIGEGENMRSVAQKYGITLKALKNMNKKVKDEAGTVLQLP